MLDLLLSKEKILPRKIADYDHVEYTHSAVAAYIASGMADVGFGVETAAKKFNLDFIPMVRERYFFACKASALKHSLLKPTLNIMQSKQFRDEVNALSGYDGSDAGVLVNFVQIFS